MKKVDNVAQDDHSFSTVANPFPSFISEQTQTQAS